MRFTTAILPLAAASAALASPMLSKRVAEPSIGCSDNSAVNLHAFQISGLAETHADYTNNTKFLLFETNTNFQFYCEGISVVDAKSFDCHSYNQTEAALPSASFEYSDDLSTLHFALNWQAESLCAGSPGVTALASKKVPEGSCWPNPRGGGQICDAEPFEVPVEQATIA